MGMLFIEPATRRRYRVNGQISLSPDQVLLSVEQAYANCPKYIQGRSVSRGLKPTYLANIVRGTTLMDDLISWIKIADTFYVGSSNGEQALDASHRGGNPGFVEVLNPTTLQIPDYKGNSMYNTLGNFLIYPKAGLLFIDFKTLRTLQLTGTARVIQKEQSLLSQKSETGRYWVFSAEEWMLLENISDTNWSFIDYSPFNPA
jgi:predicted pyridoxine 5'-phosphate oxidase superfamily flavin-nucleotide-binding protein